jgi:hypothetical protein
VCFECISSVSVAYPNVAIQSFVSADQELPNVFFLDRGTYSWAVMAELLIMWPDMENFILLNIDLTTVEFRDFLLQVGQRRPLQGNLRMVALIECQWNADAAQMVTQFLAGAQVVELLVLNNDNILPLSVLDWATTLPMVESLYIAGLEAQLPSDLPERLVSMANLSRLGLVNCHLDDNMAQAIINAFEYASAIDRMQHISLARNALTDGRIEDIINLVVPRVAHLDLRENPGSNSAYVNNLHYRCSVPGNLCFVDLGEGQGFGQRPSRETRGNWGFESWFNRQV